MIRESLAKREAEVQHGFRLRGLNDVSRVEALSDGVFAFAITLLVVSLEVPRTFDELLVTMRGFLAFAITFAMLFHVWHTQYRFFRRYGLSDNFTVWMTALLLFVVLFYVYPLKFVWTFIVNAPARPRLEGRDLRGKLRAGRARRAGADDAHRLRRGLRRRLRHLRAALPARLPRARDA